MDKKLFNIKDDIILEDMLEWEEALFWVFAAVIRFCNQHNLPLTITSMKSDRQNVDAVSNTHETNRAVDIRCSGGKWSDVWIHKLCYFLNSNYREWGAISRSTGKPLVALFHKNHIHIQVKSNCDLGKYLKQE